MNAFPSRDRTMSDLTNAPNRIDHPALGGRSPAPKSQTHYAGAGRQHTDRSAILPIDSPPLRPINGSLYHAHMLAEIRQWSREASDAIDLMSRDIFMSDDGEVESWAIAGLKDGMGADAERAKLNPDLLAISQELRDRRCGVDLVLGGSRLQQAADESLHLGDSFIQVKFEREGLTVPERDYCIAESIYMPSLSMFVLTDEHGREAAYRQYYATSTEYTDYSLLEILHFSHRKRHLYGNSVNIPSIPDWERLKRIAPKIESAIGDCGIAPWLHEMPEDTTAEDLQRYEQKIENMSKEGIIKNLYLMKGSDVRKAKNDNAGLQEILTLWLYLRQSMIPLGMPDYFFSALPQESKGARDLGQQPAMLYGRTNAVNRAHMAEQIKRAHDMEIVCRRGLDFLKKNPYCIVWPKWDSMPTQQIEVGKAEPEKDNTAQNNEASKEAIAEKLERAIAQWA